MPDTDLYRPVSALALLDRIRQDPSARRAILEEALARIDALEPQLKAVAARLDADSARRASAAARGPLQGLPVLVKDIFDTRDLPTAFGSPIHAGRQPATDAALVTLLRRQGALVLGKSVTCEFAYMSPSATTNPADPSRTPGGSSAGSAAAVAAGYVPWAIGSQTGGSVVRPASFCGVAAFKPSFGRLPVVGMKAFSWSIDTAGLFAAGVGDAEFLAQALLGEPVQALATPPVLGVPESWPWTPPGPGAQAAMAQALRALERAGARLVPVRFAGWMGELVQAHGVIQSHEAFQCLGDEFDHHRERLSPMLREYLERASAVGTGEYLEAQACARAARAQLPALFEGLDAILTPSAPDEAPGPQTTGDPAYNRTWTLLGSPCASVPGLRGPHGAPVGVQLVGPVGADMRTLAVARFVERSLG